MNKIPKGEGLTFHIIFTQGTVRHLRLFTLSLLKWLPCSFRLVANGCEPKETEMLEQFCQCHPRLEFFPLSVEDRHTHADALNVLQQRETSPYFCFMDSDILATGPFLQEILPLMQDYCAVFSGRPIWLEKGHNVMPTGSNDGKRFRGHYNLAHDGWVPGSSFFAIYDNITLNQFIADTGIGFNRYNWQRIPEQYHALLEKAKLKFERYDTAKVLNLLLQLRGETMCYIEPDGLAHLGGFSSLTLAYLPVPIKRRIKNLIKKVIYLFSASDRKSLSEKEDKDGNQGRTTIKPMINRYYIEYLHALFEDLPLPMLPALESSPVKKEVEALTHSINQYYHEFKTQL